MNHKSQCLSRRAALKIAGSVAGVAVLTPLISVRSTRAGARVNKVEFAEDPPPPMPPPASLGRVASWGVEIRESPSRKSKLIRTARRDEVFALREQVVGEAVMSHNIFWFKLDEGYAYSSWIQPVEEIFNTPEPERAKERFWGELTVPLTDARFQPDPKAGRSVRLYYTGVFRVIDAAVGPDEQWWYRLQEGVTYSPGPWVPAAHIRRFDPSELTPLSPEVEDKRIEVDLKTQTITALEHGEPVLTSKVASGYGSFFTPKGTHKVLYKYPTARMIGGSGSDAYDLPGVAFPTFITWSGIAIHGTYWHNDYGRPRSHGCLNVPSPIARWFWRWTAPVAPYEAASFYTPRGAAATTVVVT
ncbi:MAG: L,D-transpeptidase [Anaerolineae bacterium]